MGSSASARQGAQFTSAAFIGTPSAAGIRIPVDGRGRWLDNVLVERLWRSPQYDNVYLKGYADGREAHARIVTWISFYNGTRPHQAPRYREIWRGDRVSSVDMPLRLDNATAVPTFP